MFIIHALSLHDMPKSKPLLLAVYNIVVYKWHHYSRQNARLYIFGNFVTRSTCAHFFSCFCFFLTDHTLYIMVQKEYVNSHKIYASGRKTYLFLGNIFIPSGKQKNCIKRDSVNKHCTDSTILLVFYFLSFWSTNRFMKNSYRLIL